MNIKTYTPEITTAARRITRTLNKNDAWEIIFFDKDGKEICGLHESDARFELGEINFDYTLALRPKAHGGKWTQAEAQVWLDSLEQDDPAFWRHEVFAELERRAWEERF